MTLTHITIAMIAAAILLSLWSMRLASKRDARWPVIVDVAAVGTSATAIILACMLWASFG